MHVSDHLHDADHSVSRANLLRRLLMFHGPINEAVPFFEAMGFRCPERKDHASFLQEVTTPKGRPFPGRCFPGLSYLYLLYSPERLTPLLHTEADIVAAA